MKDRYSLLLPIICSCSLFIAGCSSSSQHKLSGDRKPLFGVATRQLPPEPVYNPLRWVRPPSVLPEREIARVNAPTISPIVSFEVKDAPLREAALVLAANSRYGSYCSNSIANQKLSMTVLGTVDEIAEEISKQARITVVVDHHSREVRFLAGRSKGHSIEPDVTASSVLQSSGEESSNDN